MARCSEARAVQMRVERSYVIVADFLRERDKCKGQRPCHPFRLCGGTVECEVSAVVVLEHDGTVKGMEGRRQWTSPVPDFLRHISAYRRSNTLSRTPVILTAASAMCCRTRGCFFHNSFCHSNVVYSIAILTTVLFIDTFCSRSIVLHSKHSSNTHALLLRSSNPLPYQLPAAHISIHDVSPLKGITSCFRSCMKTV